MSDWVLRILLVLMTVLYALSFAGELQTVRKRLKEKAQKLPGVLYGAAVTVNAGLIVYNYVVNLKNGMNYVPFVSMYQVTVFIGFMFFPARLFFDKVCAYPSFRTYCSAGAAVVGLGLCFLPIDAVWEFRPALQSPFFIPHIICYVLAYALSFVAAITSLHGWISKKDTSAVTALCTRLLFPFLSCGMFFGAIWADQIWGDFWSWDIKESWSLVTWLCYMVALHLYKRAGTKKFAPYLVVAGFVCVIITFLFSRVFGVASVHSY